MIYCFLEVVAFKFSKSDIRLINISAGRTEHGKEIVRLDSLVNPGRALPYSTVEGLNYDNALLARSPVFCDLVDKIWPIVDGATVVGYDINSKVDLLRREFRKIGLPISMEIINIGATPETCNSQLIDGNILPEFLSGPRTLRERVDRMLRQFSHSERIVESSTSTKVLVSGSMAGLPKELWRLAEGLPSSSGVYFFRNGEGRAVYIGKAINIRKRVISHLRSKAARERELAKATKTIDCVLTGCDLLAQLLETSEISAHLPEFNRAQLLPARPYQIVYKKDSKGYLRIYAERKTYTDSAVNYFSDRKSAIGHLAKLRRDFQLCPRFCGLERTTGACSRVGDSCDGACNGSISPEDYNLRARSAIESMCEHGSFAILEEGRDDDELSFVMIRDGFYHGFGYVPRTESIRLPSDLDPYLQTYPNTYYTARIVASYLRNRKRPIIIGPLSGGPDSLYCNV